MLTTHELVAPSATPASLPVRGRVVARRAEAVHTAAPIRVGRWLAGLAVADVAAGAAAVVLGLGLRLGSAGETVDGVSAPVVAGVLALTWCLGLLWCGAYDRRLLGTGAGEFQRVVTAGPWLLAAVVLVSFLSRRDPPRGLTVITVALVVLLTLVCRGVARRMLHVRMAAGAPLQRALVAGSPGEVAEFLRHIGRTPWCGLSVVGDCTGGGVEEVVEAARAAGADLVAVAGSGALAGPDLRRLSWRLEGTGIRLVVAPALADLAGPRIRVTTVNGLPLMHVEEPHFSGTHRVAKAAIDRVAAAVLLLLLAPLFAVLAVAIRLTSTGPAFFSQERVGLGGRPFAMYKLRTMRAGAESDQAALKALNEADGPLFKIRGDPRITPIGLRLRRLSLDELPQLWNVLTGSMSLVGPRPPLADEVARYPDDACRRLLVKPGITGLWQISGRSDLSWEETVRLDLHYVENWSVMLDLTVLWRTISAVVSARGAY